MLAACEVIARLKGGWGKCDAYSETADAWVHRRFCRGSLKNEMGVSSKRAQNTISPPAARLTTPVLAPSYPKYVRPRPPSSEPRTPQGAASHQPSGMRRPAMPPPIQVSGGV
jgi:hypothetical protein